MSGFILDTKKPTTLYTPNNLRLLVKCWNDFCTWTDGFDWRKEFPEWSFMISQFKVFVNEIVMKEMMTAGNTDRVFNAKTINGILNEMKGIQEELKGVQKKMQDMEGKMTTTTSSIEDLQGRVKELERPWYERRPKNKVGRLSYQVGSGSGERMVDLLEDLEKLSCSEKLEVVKNLRKTSVYSIKTF
jgi:polyhydroxyalkanoate synthesis regulator phasin